MANNENTDYPRLWISYPWINREERDFAYLVAQLREARIDATYDSLQLSPDRGLQERAVQRLLSVGYDGWLYILTHECFTRKTCTEELTATIRKATQHMGPDFPIGGLLHGIDIQYVPSMLRERPCISLTNPDWKKQLKETFKFNALPASKEPSEDTRFIWKIHPSFCGDPSMTAVEVRSREDNIPYWRFAIPKSAQTVAWGQGPCGGRGISCVRFGEASGIAKYGTQEVFWFGAANMISKAESAYAVFSGPLPDFICFGPAKGSLQPPGQMEIYCPALSNR
jgi:hypothetical protein